MEKIIILGAFYLFQESIIMAWKLSSNDNNIPIFKCIKYLLFWPYYFIKIF